MNIFRLLTGFLLVASCGRVHAEFAQLGPVETLDNGAVTLQVALRIGRIVSFHRHGEPDWLVVHDQAPNPGWNWNPWGGDRMWPTAQALNPQIYKNAGFDPVIDGQPWKLVSKTTTTLEMRSGISPRLGLQVTHRIELIGTTTDVLHTYRVECLAESNFPVHVWTVTGVREGDLMLMESDPRVAHAGDKPYKMCLGGCPSSPLQASLLPGTRILSFAWSKDAGLKLGTYGRWMSLVSGSTAFCQSIAYDPELLYLEESNLQGFVDAETGTYELETLSPTWFLGKGETRQWTVRWRLLDLPPTAKTVAAKAAFLKEQMEATLQSDNSSSP